VLVVDDDASQRHLLTAELSPRFRTHWATTVDQGLAQWRSVGPDLVVIGLELAGGGLDVLLEIRRGSSLPLIVVSADDRDESCVLALRLGADDYVVKPFSVPVLAARIETVLRRGADLGATSIISGSKDLRIDLGARQVFVEDQEVRLTPIEFDVLALLASQPRQVFSREHLLQSVWDSNPDWQSLATVTEHIRRLRQKLGPAAGHITTVFGRGYRFDL
jgi:two-component system, OmpR family, phosphate regulon response regulator PhoB